jgi:hypothetical protein
LKIRYEPLLGDVFQNWRIAPIVCPQMAIPYISGYYVRKHLVLFGCEIWSLTLREEHRMRVFENRVLKRIFGLKIDEVTGGGRKLHNEELLNLYSLPRIIRIMK